MKKFNDLTISIFNYFIIYLFLESFILALIPNKYIELTRFFSTLIVFIISVYASRNYFKTMFLKNCVECLEKSISLGFYTFLLVFLNLTLSSIQRTVFNADLTSVNNNQIVQAALNNPILIGIIIIIFLPVIEELLFKYQLFKNTEFLNNHWILKTIVLGIFFASMHCFTEIISLDYYALISFSNYFLFYFITNIIYRKSDNLMMPITIHCLYNTISYILIF